MKFLKNEKGFTLVEILIVILVIGILFAVIMPKLGGVSDSANETDLKAEMRQYLTAADVYMQQTNGNDMNVEDFNNSLFDEKYNLKVVAGSTETTTYQSTTLNNWGHPYSIKINNLDADKGQIIITSKKNDSRVYTSAVYYVGGQIDSCTEGFEKEFAELEVLKGKVAKCGDTLK